LPLIGSAFDWIHDQPRFVVDAYRRYGSVVRFRFVNFQCFLLFGAEANRLILADRRENFLTEPVFDLGGARWLVGRGVLFIDEPEHRVQRRLILPSMHRERLWRYQQVMQAATERVLDRWQPGWQIDVADEMDDIALIVEGQTLFSVDFSSAASELRNAVAVTVQTLNDFISIALARFPFDIPPLGHGRSVRRAIQRVHQLIDELIDEHEQSGSDAGDVVSMLLAARDQDGERLSRIQIRDNLLTLFVAGHETVANALAWTCYLLAQHPRVGRKLLDELQSQLDGRAPAVADFERLPYLEQVVKESLRLYPPAATLLRYVRNTFEWRGYTIPRGSIVMYSPLVTHRMATYYAEPYTFCPERFDAQHGEPHTAFDFLPFGAGERSCIGAPFAMLEMKTVVATLMQRYRLDLVPHQRVVAALRTTLMPKHGIRMVPWPQDGDMARSQAKVAGNVLHATRNPV
jgi:cytochrome P450